MAADGKQTVLDLVNARNPQLRTPVTKDNVTLGAATNTTTAEKAVNGYNSKVTLTAIKGKGYTGSVDIFYNRLQLNTLLGTKSNAFDWSTGITKTADLINPFMSRTGATILTALDFTSATLGTRPSSAASTPATLTAAADSYLAMGSASLALSTYNGLAVNGQVITLANKATAYSSSLALSGGKAPFMNPRISAGTLPVGLSLSVVGSTLMITGTPTTKLGWVNFTVASDSTDGQSATSITQSMFVNDNTWATYDSARTPTGVTLTTDKLTVTASNVVPILLSFAQVVTSPVTGRMAFAFTMTTGVTISNSLQLGSIGCGLQAVTGAPTLAAKGFALATGTGNLYVNGKTTVTYADLKGAIGDTFTFFVDATVLSAVKIWISKNNLFPATAYPNGADPAKGLYPLLTYDATGMVLYPVVGLTAAPQSVLGRFTPAALSALTIPTGFVPGLPL